MHPVQTTMIDKELLKAYRASAIAKMREEGRPVEIDMEFDPERYNNFFKERVANGVTTYEGDWVVSTPDRNIDEMNLVYKEYESKCPLVVTPDLKEKESETAPLSGHFIAGTSNNLHDADPNVLSRFILQSVPKSLADAGPIHYPNKVNVSKLD